MGQLLNEKKKQVHELIDNLEDEGFIDKIIALYALETIEISKTNSPAISGNELKGRLHHHIKSLDWKK